MEGQDHVLKAEGLPFGARSWLPPLADGAARVKRARLMATAERAARPPRLKAAVALSRRKLISGQIRRIFQKIIKMANRPETTWL
jgi:hypothetical protein